MKFLSFIIFTLLVISCSSPEQDFLGRWKLARSVQRGEEAPTSVIFEMEFLPNGNLICYENDSIDPIQSHSYEIKGDSIFITTVRLIMDGSVTEMKGFHYTLEDNVLMLETSDLYYTKYMSADADSSTWNDVRAEQLFLLPRNPRKDVRNFISFENPEYWRPEQGDSSVYPLEIHFDLFRLNSHFKGKCTYSHNMCVTSDSTIDVYWNHCVTAWPEESFDTTLTWHIVEQDHGAQYPENNKVFAKYTLKDDTSFSVQYYYPEWVSKVNNLAADSLFPKRLRYVGRK